MREAGRAIRQRIHDLRDASNRKLPARFCVAFSDDSKKLVPICFQRRRDHAGCLENDTKYPTRDAFVSGRKRLGSVIAQGVPEKYEQGGNSVRPCRSLPGSGAVNDESDDSDVSENNPTNAQYPP